LWGYGGEGPRGLVELLVKTGLHQKVAEFVAFETPRLEVCGIDFHLEYNHNGSVTYTTPQFKATLRIDPTLRVLPHSQDNRFGQVA
jgi:hypothetical protein